MTEEEYWLRLEYRLCRELERQAEDMFRGLWCDGFIPEFAEERPDGTWITGRVWLARGGREQWQWQFRLLLGKGRIRRQDAEWNDLLPADDVTGWLSVDWPGRSITIRPLAAHPDREPNQR